MKRAGPIVYVTCWVMTLVSFAAFVDVGLWPLIPSLPIAYMVIRAWWRERGVRVTDADLEQMLRGA